MPLDQIVRQAAQPIRVHGKGTVGEVCRSDTGFCHNMPWIIYQPQPCIAQPRRHFARGQYAKHPHGATSEAWGGNRSGADVDDLLYPQTVKPCSECRSVALSRGVRTLAPDRAAKHYGPRRPAGQLRHLGRLTHI